MGLWAKSLRIFNAIRANGPQSVRRLATRTGLAKSRGPRHTQAMARRDRHPESWWWATEAGHRGLLRRGVAALWPFGRKRGVGAGTLRECFGRLRLEAQSGCSPSTWRRGMEALEAVLLETVATGEHDGGAAVARRPISGAVDDTCVERLLLVCMDLARGDVWAAAVAADRREDTWDAGGKARRATLGGGVRSLGSDRAKARIKRAATALACLRVPAWFPLLHALAKRSALASCSRLRHAPQALRHAPERLATCQGSPPGGAAVHQAPAWVEAHEAEGPRWQGVRRDDRHHLEPLSRIRHPWRLVGSTPPTSHEVAGP
jgi:hypothetical protein